MYIFLNLRICNLSIFVEIPPIDITRQTVCYDFILFKFSLLVTLFYF